MKIYIVDAFTGEPFAGNPAAVCMPGKEIDDGLRQKIAAEMNLSETAFLVSSIDGFDLRWFTPVTEVDHCGHATLASAHVLWEEGVADADSPIRFNTRSGTLDVTRQEDGLISMDFPREDVKDTICPEILVKCLGYEVNYCGRNRMDYLVEVASEDVLDNMEPDEDMISRLDSRGLIVTAGSDTEKYDFVSRFFAPQSGIPEDPVTGSAHCALGPYWSARLGKNELTGRQKSSRGGIVYVKINHQRVIISGEAVTVMHGYLLI